MKPWWMTLVLLLLADGLSAQRLDNVMMGRMNSEYHPYKLVRLYSGLRRPWALEFLPDGAFLVSERGGRLLLMSGETVREVSGLPEIAAWGQGGLLDLALDPDFQRNRLLYFSFARPGAGGSGTAVARATLEGATLKNLSVIWELRQRTGSGLHFGSRLRFLPDGTLVVTVGDRGEMKRAQSLKDGAGKIHRINRDGSIPPDNPLLGVPGALGSIYSYGHRNSQGMAVQPGSGILWATEHGPMGGDELNLIRAGGNYGWPVVTHGRQYGTGAPIGEGSSKPGMVDPVIQWTPSPAPSGLDFYQGTRFPAWRGDLFSGNLAGAKLIRLRIHNGRVSGQEELLNGVIGRIREVRSGPDGYLYLLTDSEQGGLYRLEPTD